jgi:hypothetical protein
MTANAEASALTTEASAKVLDKLLVLDITDGCLRAVRPIRHFGLGVGL